MSTAGFPCARCGRVLRRTSGERPRRIRCPRCRYLIYDYPRPCAGLIVVKGDAVLLLRRAHAPRKGRLDVPGGFMDANEDIERAARRELEEETGLRVGRVEPLGFYWDRYYLKGFGYFPTMNFYYLARWNGGTPRAADDAASAEWVPVARLGRSGAGHAWKHMTALFRDVRRRLSGRGGSRAARVFVLAVLLAAPPLAGSALAGGVPDSTQRGALQSRIGRLGEVRIVGPAGTTLLAKPVVRADGIHMREPYHPPRPALIVIGDAPAPARPAEFVPWGEIEAVQVREGLQPRSMVMGLGIGALLGGLVSRFVHSDLEGMGLSTPAGIALFAVPGAVVGLAFGAGAQHWRTVHPPPPRRG